MNDVWMINQRINKLVPIAKNKIDEGDFKNAQETTEIIQRLIQWRREIMIRKNQEKLLKSQVDFKNAQQKIQNAVIGATYAVNQIAKGIQLFSEMYNFKK